MRAWLITACLVLGASPPGRAQEDDSVGAVRNDYYTALSNNSKKQPKNLPAGVSAPLMTETELQGLLARLWKIYDVSAGDPAELDALFQVVALSSTPYVAPPSDKTIEAWREATRKIFTDFLDDDRVASLVMNFEAPGKLKREVDELTKQLGNSKSRAVKAAFAYQPLAARADAAANAPLAPEAEAKLLADMAAFASEFGAAEIPGRGTSYADWVKNTSYSLLNLKIGGIAPEIEAGDLDGVKFKLSDYRGKVVLLDFWGYW